MLRIKYKYIKNLFYLKKFILFQYFSAYGPDFTLDMNAGNRKDFNSFSSLNNIYTVIAGNNIFF